MKKNVTALFRLSESTRRVRFSGPTALPKPLCESGEFIFPLTPSYAVIKLFSAPAKILIDRLQSKLYIAWEDDII